MNIFFIDSDPVKAAQAHVDRHVVKMIVETAQILSTAHRLLDGELTVVDTITKKGKKRKKKIWRLPDGRDNILYHATHVNHPSCVWTRESVSNYLWLVELFYALCDEYTHRYGKVHKTFTKLAYEIQSPPLNLKNFDSTPIHLAMDREFIISDDAIENYRNYYRIGKKSMHKWKNREAPEWL